MLEYVFIDVLGYEVKETCRNILATLLDLQRDKDVKSIYDIDNSRYLKREFKAVRYDNL
jgi:hypothetical protein